MSTSYRRIGEIHQFTRHIASPEEFRDAVSTVNLSVDLLGASQAGSTMLQFQADTWAMDWSVTQVRARVRGNTRPGWATMALVHSDIRSIWSGLAARPGLILCNPPGIDLDGFVHPGFAWTAVSIAPALWNEAGMLAGGAEPFEPTGFFVRQLSVAGFQELIGDLEAFRLALGGGPADPVLATHLERQGLHLARHVAMLAREGYSAGPEAQPAGSLRHRVRLARRAESWIREHLPDSFLIADVCLALRVSRRELEYAFAATFDTAPRAYVQNLRLNAVRKALGTADPIHDSVSRIALDHGICHLGRFAGAYRHLFGELPTDTLHRRA